MSKVILLFLTCFFLGGNYSTAQWEIMNEGLRGQINTIDFVNEDVGWMAGYNGTLLKTTDGGKNWNDIPIDECWDMLSLIFFNESIGWAIGADRPGGDYVRVVWKSLDGGLTWTQQLSNVDFGSLYILDENNVYAIGGGTIFKTIDGGVNWIDVSPNLPDRNYNSVWFQNSQTGVVVGSYNDGTADRGLILQTTNGGVSWNETIVNEFNNIFELQFLNSTNGYFRANLDTSNFICKTEDMCLSWVVKTQHPYSINSYQFLKNNLAYAIMSDSITVNNIMKSSDEGNNWHNIPALLVPPFGYLGIYTLNKIYFVNQDKGFLIGGGCFYKSLDGGLNWEILKINYPFKDVCFFNKDTGFLIGGVSERHGWMGNIFSLLDGGKTLKLKNNNSIFFKSCVNSNYSNAFVTGYGVIYKTTDQANTWELKYQNDPYEFEGNDISFQNEDVGYSVGSGILNTTNAGENWSVLWADSTVGSLYSICHASTTRWTVGESGLMVKYTPQTGWVKQTSVTDLPLNKVFFTDDNHGWIAGGYQNNDFQNIFLETTNGGESWEKVQNVIYLIKDIVFLDNNFGWAIGYDSSGVGGILNSTDGGSTWTIDTGNLSAELNALHIKDNYAWAVGDNGLILRNTNIVSVGTDNTSSHPTEFILEQNFPNPFNPSTIISYQLPVAGRVRLKVFDILGNEAATLVDEYKPAGNYKVEFNAKKLASGVYLYQLKSGDHIATKKMLLLK